MRYFFVLGMLVLAGCSNNEPMYYSQPTSRDMAQLIVYHPSGEFIGSATIGSGPNVKINGDTVCGLPNGSFFIKSVPSGNISISSTKALALGTSVLNIKTVSNKKYYVRITWNDDKAIGAFGAGLLGEAVTEGVSSDSGPFSIHLEDEKTAIEELSSLKRSSDCSTIK